MVGACVKVEPGQPTGAGEAYAAMEEPNAFARAMARIRDEPNFAYRFKSRWVGQDGVEMLADAGVYAQRDLPDGTPETYLRRDGNQVFHRIGNVEDQWDRTYQTHTTLTYTDTVHRPRLLTARFFTHVVGIVEDLRNTPSYTLDSTLEYAGRTVQVFRLARTPIDSLDEYNIYRQERLVYVDPATDRVVRTLSQQIDVPTGEIISTHEGRLSDYSVPLDEAFARPHVTLERFRYELPRERDRHAAEEREILNRKGIHVAVGDTFPIIAFADDRGAPTRLPEGPMTYMFANSACGAVNYILRRLDSLRVFKPDAPRITLILSRISEDRDRAYLRTVFPDHEQPPLPVAIAPMREVADAYGIIASPTWVTVDGSGLVTAVEVGSTDEELDAWAQASPH